MSPRKYAVGEMKDKLAILVDESKEAQVLLEVPDGVHVHKEDLFYLSDTLPAEGYRVALRVNAFSSTQETCLCSLAGGMLLGARDSAAHFLRGKNIAWLVQQ